MVLEEKSRSRVTGELCFTASNFEMHMHATFRKNYCHKNAKSAILSLRKMQKIITIKYINKNCARYHLDKSLQLSRKFMSRDISEVQDAVTKHFCFCF